MSNYITISCYVPTEGQSPKNQLHEVRLKITLLKLLPHLWAVNELIPFCQSVLRKEPGVYFIPEIFNRRSMLETQKSLSAHPDPPMCVWGSLTGAPCGIPVWGIPVGAQHRKLRGCFTSSCSCMHGFIYHARLVGDIISMIIICLCSAP